MIWQYICILFGIYRKTLGIDGFHSFNSFLHIHLTLIETICSCPFQDFHNLLNSGTTRWRGAWGIITNIDSQIHYNSGVFTRFAISMFSWNMIFTSLHQRMFSFNIWWRGFTKLEPPKLLDDPIKYTWVDTYCIRWPRSWRAGRCWSNLLQVVWVAQAGRTVILGKRCCVRAKNKDGWAKINIRKTTFDHFFDETPKCFFNYNSKEHRMNQK